MGIIQDTMKAITSDLLMYLTSQHLLNQRKYNCEVLLYMVLGTMFALWDTLQQLLLVLHGAFIKGRANPDLSTMVASLLLT